MNMLVNVNPEFFEDEKDVRTYANKTVGELLEHYPKVSILPDIERIALHTEAVEHLTGEILDRIEASEPIALAIFTPATVRDFLKSRDLTRDSATPHIKKERPL